MDTTRGEHDRAEQVGETAISWT